MQNIARRARCYGNFYELSIKSNLQKSPMVLTVKLYVEKKLKRQMGGEIECFMQTEQYTQRFSLGVKRTRYFARRKCSSK